MELRPELELLKKSLTADKIAEFTHQAVSRSDLNLLETIYLYGSDVYTDRDFLNYRYNDTVPLVLAAQVGCLEVFNYLIEHHANIEAKGNCDFDNEIIVDVTPLWVASAAGHQEMVVKLIDLGANVNSTTSTNSTPLRAACYDGHLEVAKLLLEMGADINMANRHGHTSLMIAAFRGHLEIIKLLLTKKDININAASTRGNTALHDAAEAGNLEVLQELLKAGASVELDQDGISPLRLAALHGKEQIVQYFGSGKFIDHAKADIAFKIEKEDIIESIELLGCWHVDRKKDIMKGLRSWSWGAFLRYPDKPNRTRLEKRLLEPKAELDYQIEANTPAEINELLNDINKLRINSLLVRQRILGPANPQTVHYIRYRGAIYADSGDYQKCLDLWSYGINLQINNLPMLHASISTSFLSFVDFFAFCETKQLRNPTELEKFFFTFDAHLGDAEIHANRVKLSHDELEQFIRLRRVYTSLIGILFQSSLARVEEIRQCITKRAHYIDQSGSSLLHYSCDQANDIGRARKILSPASSARFNKFPNSFITQILLELTRGLHVNIINQSGMRPIHLAVKGKCKETSQLLLNYGAHASLNSSMSNFHSHFKSLMGNKTINQQIRLKCLAACAVSKTELEVPHHLRSFVVAHTSMDERPSSDSDVDDALLEDIFIDLSDFEEE